MTRSEIDAKLTYVARRMAEIPWDGVEITPPIRALLDEQAELLRMAAATLPSLQMGLETQPEDVLSDEEVHAVVMARARGAKGKEVTSAEFAAVVDWARGAAIERGLLLLVSTGQVVIVGMNGEDNPVFEVSTPS